MSGEPLKQVGIAVAVPLTWEDFRGRVEHSDWLSKYFDRDLGQNDLDVYLKDRWESEYLPLVVKPLSKVIAFAAQGGASVYTSATLKDIRSITEEKQVAILCTHWKGPETVFEDLLEHDRTAFLNRLQGNDENLAVWLHSQIRRVGDSTSKFVDVLSKSLDFATERKTGEGATIILESDVTRHAIVREKLNALFSGLLRPGNRLELYDGLHTKEVLEQAIAPGFQGVLDLALCESTVPADYIAARRHHALRTLQSPYQIEFVWVASGIAQTLSLFSSGNFNYQEARQAVGRIYQSEMQKILREV